MLKLQSASAVLQLSRRTLAASVPATTCKMSTTDGTVRPPPTRSVDNSEEYRQTALRPSAAVFPLGYKEAAYQWWSNLSPQLVERNVLSYMPYLKEVTGEITNPNAVDKPDPYGHRIWRRSMVQLSGKNRALNEVSVERVGEETEETLVMLHGYGAGLGFFYKNFEPLTRIQGLKLYALDMLGCGNSTRPTFRIQAKEKEDQVIEAENWFIDALEEWRKARRIERFTLLGHSLGGYLAVSYAIKYPGRLKKLILASPVGIPEDPYAVNAAMPEPGETPTIEAEMIKDQEISTEAASTLARHKPAHVVIKRPLPGWFVWLWDQNISPFSIVRMTGPLGPRFVSGWSSRRFNHLPPAESQALHDYSFSIFKQKGSGEYALAYILAPGAYARRPVINRIHEVGRQPLPQPNAAQLLKETGIPVVFMYGENDWMDVAGGLAAQEKMNQAKQKALQQATEEEKRHENGSTKVLMVSKAGHHLYLDNPDEFNEMVRKELLETKEYEKLRNRRIKNES